MASWVLVWARAARAGARSMASSSESSALTESGEVLEVKNASTV